MQYVRAQFEKSGHTKIYIVRPGDTPEPGDMLLTSFTESESGFASTLRTATVMEVTSIPPATWSRNVERKPYLVLIKAAYLRERRELVKQMQEKAAKELEARRELDELLEKEDALSKYRSLATRNDRARELLAIIEE